MIIHHVPILTRRDLVVFPRVARTLELEAPGLAAVRAAVDGPGRRLLILPERTLTSAPRASACGVEADAPHRATRREASEGPRPAPGAEIGTLAVVTRLVPSPGRAQALVQGLERAVVEHVETREDHTTATVRTSPLAPPHPRSPLELRVVELTARLVALRSDTAVDLGDLTEKVDGTARIYVIAALLGLGLERDLAILDCDRAEDVLERLHAHVTFQLEILESLPRSARATTLGPSGSLRRARRRLTP